MGDEWDQGGASFEEVQGEEGPCSKICGAFGVCYLGLFLFPLSLFLLGWNEQDYVCTDKQIIYADANAEEVGCFANQVQAGTFAFFSCPFVQSTLQTFKPCMFNVEKGMSCESGIGNALSFVSVSGSQMAEMYQCVQTENCQKKKQNGQNVNVCTYTYKPEWRGNDISDGFKDPNMAAQGCPGFNPSIGNPQFPTNIAPGTGLDAVHAPPPVKLGDPNASFTLSNALAQSLYPDTPVILAPTTPLTGKSMSMTQPPQVITVDNVILQGNYIISCTQPTIGCVRISYKSNQAVSPSVLAKVSSGGMTGPETISGSWLCSSSEYAQIRGETYDKKGMINQLKGENTTKVWLLRIIGILLAWISVFCVFAPCAMVADLVGDIVNFLPCCGGYLEDFIEGVANAIICLLSCGIGCSCAFFVIGVVWVAMRPMVGIPLMLLACCCCGGGIFAFTMFKDNGRIGKSDGGGTYSPEDGYGSE